MSGNVSTNEHRPPKAKILVVEDEAVVALDLKAQICDMGYDVCAIVDNGRDAIDCANAERPDLVLMDIVIKGSLDGIEAADQISRSLHIPVVFLTAYSDDATVERAAHAAPYGYLNKPFQSRELRAGIEVALYKAKLEQRLRDSEKWFASALRGVADAVLATDEAGIVHFINPVAEHLLGWSADEVIGRDVADVMRLQVPGTGAELPSPALRALREDAVVGIEFGTLLITRNGTAIPIDDSAAPIRDDQQRVLGAVMVFRDVRERLAAEQRLKQSEARFRDTFDFAPVGMALVSLDNRFLRVNGALCQLLDKKADELLGSSQSTFDQVEETELERGLLNELVSGMTASVQFEKHYRRADNSDVWASVSVSLLNENNLPLCFLFQVVDVTERKAAEHRLARLAHFDPLTGLANRTWLAETLVQSIAVARRHRHRLALVFLDLDHFKQINDTLGHDAGDEALKILATRMRASVRATDGVCRLGGDEFVILLPEIDQIADILVVTDKVRNECSQPVEIAGKELQLGLSMGVSLFPDDAQDPPTLLRYADSALYHAKAEGRDHLQFYRPELTATMENRIRLVTALRVALERNEFELYYQGILSLKNQRPCSAEALIRWNHPEMGLLQPDSFIAIAEEVGLSVSIGEWVIGEACREAARWGTAIPLGVSVNVSAAQFEAGNLAQIVERELKASQLDPKRLCIEITEQFLVCDNDITRTVISALKLLGVRIAIDDFGVGYSSLSSIGRFNPSELKIDRSLISGTGVAVEQVAIVTAAVAMAHSLHLAVVTEGVETLAQQQMLQDLGCDFAQGFLYAEPRPATDFVAWLAKIGAA
ncbi:MAG: EAL domain-containing protein [Duganella sp.]